MPSPGFLASIRLLVALVSLSLGFASAAATVNVAVVDSAGKPLPSAVVTLEPATGKAAFKAGAQVEVGQRKRQFTPQVTVVTVGTPVTGVLAPAGVTSHSRPGFSVTSIRRSGRNASAQGVSKVATGVTLNGLTFAGVDAP